MSIQSNGDENLWVKFYPREVELKAESEKSGRPIKETKVYVSIVVPGNMNERIDRKATDADKERFPKQWQSYLNGQSEQIHGTPVSEWTILTEGQRDHLRAIRFMTVEQIAKATDAQVTAIGPEGFSLRLKAKAFIEQAAEEGAAQRYAAENEALRSDMARKDEQIAELARRLEMIEQGAAEAPKRRGRPPKTA